MSEATARRCLLESVPRVHFWEGGPRCPEDLAFPSCLRAALEGMRDRFVGCTSIRSMAREPDWQVGCTYGFNLLTSGMAFQQWWNPAKWQYPGDILRMAPRATEPIERALEAAGYACETVGNAALDATLGYAPDTFPQYADEAGMRARIVASLQQGRPVIAFGVIGPPEACLISGYDEGGNVLIGWNFFQGFPNEAEGVEFEPTGQFRKRDWFPKMVGIVLFGDKLAQRSTKDAFRKALAWNVALARTPEVRGLASGLAALDAWADALERDADFPEDDWPVRRERFACHNGMIGNIAEQRWYTSVALGHAAYYDGGIAEEILRAAGHCATVHDLCWKIWDCAGGIGEDDDKARQGTTPAARRASAVLIRQIRAEDEQAIQLIEHALNKPRPIYG